MRTRTGLCYPRVVVNNMCSEDCFSRTISSKRRKRDGVAGEQTGGRKKRTGLLWSPSLSSAEVVTVVGGVEDCDFFEALPDDLLVSILCKLSSTATCPADFINVLITYVPLLFSSLNLIYFMPKSVISHTMCL